MKNKKLFASLLAGFLAAVMLLSLMLGLIPHDAKAASSSEIKDRIEQIEKDQARVEKELAELKKQQKENLSDIKDMVKQKSVIEQQVGLLHEQIDLMNEQIAAYSLLIADKQLELDAAEKRLEDLNKKYKERIRAMEEGGGLNYWSVLFEASSFADFLDRLNMIEEIAASDRRRLKEMEEAAKEVEQARQEMLVEKAELEASKAALDATQTALDAKAKEANELLQQLLAKGEEFDKLQEKQEDKLLELELSLGQAKVDYEDAKYKEYLQYLSTMPTGGGKISYDKNGTAWVVPCSYKRVSSGFGYRIHPVYGYKRFHAGVDFATGCPNKIYASRAGVVTISKYSDTAGWYVTIDHLDGYISTYMHMCKRPDVKVGDVVAAGQVIGCIGTTGTSTGNHLHFGIYYNGNPVNPMEYVGN